MQFDLIIERGELIDGSGSPRTRADVGVRDGRIAAVGDLAGQPSQQRMDAGGLVVAPGFIDVHTHDDRLLLEGGDALRCKLLQGVTTVVTGNCGISLAPLQVDEPPPPLDVFGAGGHRFASFASYLDALERSRPAVNAVSLIGHSTLRVNHVADLNRPASRREIAAMREALSEALQAGAWGFSTGLYYPTASAATTEEVIDVGAPLSAGAAPIAMHLRDEGDGIVEAMQEGLHIGRALKVPVVFSHHKIVGRANHGRSAETLKLLEHAAREQSVCMDCYPYDASSTMLMPSRIRHSTEVLVTWSRPEPAAAGRSLFELARERQETPEQTAIALAPAGAVYFAMDEADVQNILSHPLTMIGSDGLGHDTHPHPRLWGTFPRVLGRYVREVKLLPLEAAVHKMTGLSALRFGLAGRGQVAEGFRADLVLFNPDEVQDRASYREPHLAPAGIEAVFVNGVLACRQGVVTNQRAGQVLRRGRPAA
ncbi:N-acyl-D-amino-acid deacylase family protein [Variovorax terrae]|uniref:D-aminoacylase n=1 Tax=Variovorax terrae TaxID=2923278 RepID=A0A9X1VT58_9BURK|nr:D-aminoacylase [Variovorax terrae]MCJ0763441.1 D-aminoacylase [Variovorax terrae]